MRRLNAFGDLVRRLRFEKRWTLKDLERKVGVRKGYLSQIETGAVNPPSPRVVRRMALVFGFERRKMLALAHVVKADKEVRDGLVALVMEKDL